MIRLLTIGLCTLALAGCAAEAELSSDRGNVGGIQDPEEPPVVETSDAVGFFRIDVYPSDFALSEAARFDSDIELPPQTFEVLAEQSNIDLQLTPPVNVEGLITGWGVTPYAGPDLPGDIINVPAQVRMDQPGSVHGRVTLSDGETGEFAMAVVPGVGYTATVVPQTGDIPFFSELVTLNADLTYDVDLGYGTALWGTVSRADGSPMVGAAVRAQSADGTQGALVHTDEQGRYLLRVLPDLEYRIISLGDEGLDPVVTTDPFFVGLDGAERNVTYPTVTSSLPIVSGRLAGGIENATVRLTSLALDGFTEDAHLVRSDRSSEQGLFDIRVAPGTYTAEVLLTDVGQPYTAVDLGVLVVGVGMDLGDISLPGLADITGTVTDELGYQVAGALVQVEELGFGQRSWTTTTNSQGVWSLAVPGTPVAYTVTPPPDRPDLALTVPEPDPSFIETAGIDGLDLTMLYGVQLDGNITWDDEGRSRPLQLSVVEVRDQQGNLWALGLTDYDGDFHIQVAWTP